jgi:cytochrome c6
MNHLSFQISQRLCCALALAFVLSSSALADDAATIYKAKCVACHAADGSGSEVGKKLGAHDFSSPDVQKMADADLIAAISNGKNKMPAYGKSLKPDDIKALVVYVRQFGKK